MSRSNRRAEPSMADVLRLVAALARPGSILASPPAADAGRMITVLPGGSVGEALTLPRAALDRALARRWVEPRASGGGFTATPAGREALRRARVRLAAERASSGSGDPVLTSLAAPQRSETECPLAWLASRRDATGRPLIEPAELAAGERLRMDLAFAEMTPRVTMSWSGVPGGGGGAAAASGLGRDIADTVAAARTRVAAALEAVGPEHAGILIDVCGHLRGLEDVARVEGWPARAARLLLQRALAALARHYGLLAPVPVEETIRRRLRHWGSDGYRPTLARWSRPAAQGD